MKTVLPTMTWLLLVSAMAMGAQGSPMHHPGDLPKQFHGMAAGSATWRGRTAAVEVVSRRTEDPEKPSSVAAQRVKVTHALTDAGLQLAASASEADLLLKLVDEPHLRWGMYHSQVDFYVFLEVRERRGGKLLYCAYRRAGFLHSATSSLLDEFVAAAKGGQVDDAGIEDCARLAANRGAH